MALLTELERKRVDEAFEKADAAAMMVVLSEALDRREGEVKQKFDDLAGELRKDIRDDTRIKELSGSLEDLLKKQNEVAADLLEMQQKMARPMGGRGEPDKSLGQAVVECDDFKLLADERIRNLKMPVPSLFERKDLSSDGASAGALVEPLILQGVLTPPDQPLTIRDLLMPGRTTSNAIAYYRETGFDNQAKPVQELKLKPQSDLKYDKQSVSVSTIAHWMFASKQILADAPQLASYINGRLIYGLKFVEEEQLLFGDGSGENLHGIMPQASAWAQTIPTTMPNKMDYLRMAMLQVELALYPPSGIVLHPTDWAEITLTKDANGNYLVANPQSTLSRILWSLPIVASMSMPMGTFLVGAFRLGAQIFDREDASIVVSLEDRDNLIRNAVTILAEERLALAVYRPEAFVTGTFDAVPGGGTNP